eukprot:scaffold37041_cov298-Isochrysis_galbana.AAC.1
MAAGAASHHPGGAPPWPRCGAIAAAVSRSQGRSTPGKAQRWLPAAGLNFTALHSADSPGSWVSTRFGVANRGSGGAKMKDKLQTAPRCRCRCRCMDLLLLTLL